MVVGAVIVVLSPAGPIIAIGAAVGGLIYGARWIAAHLRDRGSVVRERGVLRGVIIPGIMRAVNAVSSAVTRAAGFLTGVLTRAVDGLGAAVGAIGSSIFRFLLGIVRWILEQVGRLASWALEKVTAVAEFIARGLARLASFLQPVLDVIVAIGEVIADLLNIVKLIFARAWNLIPACIRDPIVEFIRDQILKRIPVFSQLLEIPDIWTKVKETALTIIRQIFRDGDLIGAAITFFKAVLRILSIPVELVTGIFTKAAAALGSIVRSPIRFLRSVLGAAWQGFKQFFGKILTYLLGGVLDWLTGELKEAGVVVPSEWSFVGVLKLVLSVLGVTLEKIWKLLARKIGDPLVEKLKKAIGFLTGAWEWVAAVITEGPVGLWRKLQEQIGQLKDLVVGAVAGYVSETVVGQAMGRILTALNPVGAIVNAILLAYKAIQTAARYARQILEIVNRVLDAATDLAAGAVAGAANIIEWALARVLPIAIGFLANYLGLGGFGHKVAEMVKKIQDRVEKAIESVIDWAINAGRSLLNALGLGGKPDDRTEIEKQRDLDAAIAEAETIAADQTVTDAKLRTEAHRIRKKYRLTTLALVQDSRTQASETVHFEGEINPKKQSRPAVVRLGGERQVTLIRSQIGAPVKRRQYERWLPGPSKVGLDEWERAHAQGAGFGKEFRAGILYAPREVNQVLQNRGIEDEVRDLYKSKRPDVDLFVQTITEAHPGTVCLAKITYTVSGRPPGRTETMLFDAWITVSNDVGDPAIGFGLDYFTPGSFDRFREEALAPISLPGQQWPPRARA
jgi:phage-related protein